MSSYDTVVKRLRRPMTPAPQIAFAPMSTRDGTLDLRTRQRIAANLRYLQYKNEFVSISAMAKAIGMSRSALTRYLKGERTAGLDVLLLVHRRLHVSIDWLVDREPDACWLDPNYWPLNGVRPLRPVPPAQ